MKSKNAIIIVLILFVIYYAHINGLLSVYGFTTLALSSAQFSSSSQWWTGNTWILTVAQGGLGQRAEGIISASSIGASSGQTPQKDLNITMEMTGQNCFYNINKDVNAQPIYVYQIYNLGSILTCPSTSSQCYTTPYKPVGSLDCYCVGREQMFSAIATSIAPPYYTQRTDITVTAGFNKVTKSFDTKGQTAGYVGDNVYAIWNGYAMRDICPTDYQQYYGFLNTRGGDATWQVGSKSLYNDYVMYKANFEQFIQDCASGVSLLGPCNVQNFQTYVNTVNSKEAVAVNPVRFGTSPATEVMNNSVSGASIQEYPNTLIGSSLWTMYVKADWLGIYQPTPNIVIQDVQCPTFKSNGFVQANLYNSGDETGNANVWVTCNSPIVSNGQSKQVGLASKTSDNVYLDISAVTTSPTSASCIVSVQNLPGQTYTKSITCQVNPEQLCTPNLKTCANDVIIQCNSYGSAQTDVQDCKATNQICQYVNNVPTCVDKAQPGCNFLDFGCYFNNAIQWLQSLWTGLISGTTNILIWIGIIVIGYIVLKVILKNKKLW